jgi:hypothetical protein
VELSQKRGPEEDDVDVPVANADFRSFVAGGLRGTLASDSSSTIAWRASTAPPEEGETAVTSMSWS